METEEKKEKGSPMKYVVILILIITIVWGGTWYLDYKRFSPPNEYSYEMNDAIDIHYHDQMKVQQYHENVYRLTSFANEQWTNYGIDVQFPDNENPQSIAANKVFDQMMSTTAYLEKLLLKSAELKKSGLNNADIKEIEISGESAESLTQRKLFGTITIESGARGENVKRIQQKLNQLGFNVPETGLYSNITEEAIIAFQDSNKLFPTGVVNQQTLQVLLNKTK